MTDADNLRRALERCQRDRDKWRNRADALEARLERAKALMLEMVRTLKRIDDDNI